VAFAAANACALDLMVQHQGALQQSHFPAARIFRARSTTISDVTWFMQA
jgi:hypothetical protein